MAKLKCERVAHPPDSLGLAIGDFYLFSHLNDKLVGFHDDEDAELLRETQGI
jgi:hypothetical protein